MALDSGPNENLAIASSIAVDNNSASAVDGSVQISLALSGVGHVVGSVIHSGGVVVLGWGICLVVVVNLIDAPILHANKCGTKIIVIGICIYVGNIKQKPIV